MTEAADKIVRTTRQMFSELGREPTPEELAKKLHMPPEKVRHIMAATLSSWKSAIVL